MTCTIILIHGLFQNSLSMKKMQNNLQNVFPDRKIKSLPIILGHLSSFFETPEYYMKEIERQIQLTNSTCVDIIGHSMGGFFARAYAQTHNNVRNLITTSGVQAGFFCEKCFGLPKSILTHGKLNSRFAQNNILPANLWRFPDRENSQFFRDMLEKPINVEKYVCFWTESDEILMPPESGKHGFWNENGEMVDVEKLDEYKPLGLDKLNEEGRFIRIHMQDYKHNDYLRSKSKDFVENYLKNYL